MALFGDTGGLSTSVVQVTWDTEFFLVIRGILWRCHEIAGHLVVTQGENTLDMCSCVMGHRASGSVQLYSEDSLEMVKS